MKPGFNVMILTVPNFERKTIKSYFFGLNKPTEQYPIKDYWFSNDSINFTLYNKFEDNIEIKSIHLDKFKKISEAYSILNISKYNVQNNVLISKSEVINNFIINKKFLFGTDIYGRDLFSRVLLGTRVSLSIGIMAVLISTLIGLFFGSIGGYYGGLIDKIIVYIINVFYMIYTY